MLTFAFFFFFVHRSSFFMHKLKIVVFHNWPYRIRSFALFHQEIISNYNVLCYKANTILCITAFTHFICFYLLSPFEVRFNIQYMKYYINNNNNNEEKSKYKKKQSDIEKTSIRFNYYFDEPNEKYIFRIGMPINWVLKYVWISDYEWIEMMMNHKIILVHHQFQWIGFLVW